MVDGAKRLQAQQRALTAKLERQVRIHEARDPERVARDKRIKQARREVRRAIRRREALRQEARREDQAASAALQRILDEGMSIQDTAVFCGLSRSAAKRFVRQARANSAASESAVGNISAAPMTSGVHARGGDAQPSSCSNLARPYRGGMTL